jgi:SAM-dependent methyltransferase
MNSPKDSKKRFSDRVDNYVKYRPSYPKEAVDFIISAQAFHWFDKKLARVEFARILKPEGKVVLIWNHRQIAQSSFDHAYEEMLKKFGTDYEQVKQAKINEKDYKEFFKEGQYKKDIFANRQVFDFAGLQGRLLSSSYTPLPNV